MKYLFLGSAVSAALSIFVPAGNAYAALIGVVQSFPDVTLGQNYLIYDHDGLDANTGLLKIVSRNATLNEGPDVGNSTLTQSYVGNGDNYLNLMLTIAIDRTTGNWVSSGNPVANQVSIGFGNSVIANGPGNTPGFNWQGTITNFGWLENLTSTPSVSEAGTFFDATWLLSNDDYEDMPASMAQFTDSTLTGTNGGIKISNSSGFGAVSNPFQRDWIFGASAKDLSLTQLTTLFGPQLLSGLSTNICSNNAQTGCISRINSTVTADVFVPILPAAWLWVGSLPLLMTSFKRTRITTFTGVSTS